MQFSRAFDTLLPHNLNPTHHVAYTLQSPFLHINTNFNFNFAYYLYALSWQELEYVLQ